MPAPTKVYEIVLAPLTVVGPGEHVTDMTKVNELAGQGYDVQEMLQIGGGGTPGRFVFLMSRTVTSTAKENKKE